MEKQTYTAKLSLYIRSDDANGTYPGGSSYELRYIKTAEMPMPPAPGISVMTWKPTPITEVIIDNDGDIICHFEDQVLPADRFEQLMERYKKYLANGGWQEDIHLRIWPDELSSEGEDWRKVPLNNRIDCLWKNPRRIDLDSSFLYYICVSDGNGGEYRYVGRARNKERLSEYGNNMKKIHAGEELGIRQRYRAVHLALYRALLNGWRIKCYPLENTNGDATRLERRRRVELNCNLNGARTWRVSQMPALTIDELLR